MSSETYSYNHPKIPVLTKDIRKIDPKKLNLKNVDGIIGGPPCQGFSLSGNRDTKDPRNSLFIDFVRFVKILQPKFFVMENVKGLLSMKTKKNLLVKDIIFWLVENLDSKKINGTNNNIIIIKDRKIDLDPVSSNRINEKIVRWSME